MLSAIDYLVEKDEREKNEIEAGRSFKTKREVIFYTVLMPFSNRTKK